MIARRVDCYRTYQGETPETLDIMGAFLEEQAKREPVATGCAGATPDDPTTGAPYRYMREEGDAFRLCAGFDRGWPDDFDDPDDRVYRGRYYDAGHERRTLVRPDGAGEACFTFDAVDLEEEKENE